MKQIEFKIEGMMCSHCQNQVTKIFKEIEGVNDVVVDLESSIAQISFNENVTNEVVLNNALKDTNYTIV